MELIIALEIAYIIYLMTQQENRMVKFIIFEELSVRTGSVLKHQGITTWDQVPDDLMKMRMPRANYQRKYKTEGKDYWMNFSTKLL